jgi:small conductance mechanosensitive channel
MTLLAQIDPNDLIDTTGVGLQEGVLAGIVLVSAVVVGALIRRVVTRAASRWSKTRSDAAVFLGRMVGWFIILLGLVAALMIVGFQLGPMFLIITLVGVIVFLSARGLLENFGAGIVLQTESPFRIGEIVEVDGERGTVRDITGRATVLDTPDGRRIRIPNSQVLGEAIVNYSERGALRSDMVVGVEYGTDLERAREAIIDALSNIEGVREHPTPEALVVEFGESSVDFSVRCWHEPSLNIDDRLTDRVARAIAQRFQTDGLVIAFPQVVVWRAGDSDAPMEL